MASAPACGSAAACSNVMRAGFGSNADSGAQTYSANAPKPPDPKLDTSPKTASPRRNRSTRLPTATTVPATSQPPILTRGGELADTARRIAPTTRKNSGGPLRMNRSKSLSDDACTRTSTSFSAGTGLATSRSSGEPDSPRTIAFIVLP